MLSAFAQVFRTPELRKKLLFTLGIIVIFRLGSSLPAPNVDMGALNAAASAASSGENAGIYAMINLFSGGALLQLSVFALGIMPYITSSIILQLLTVVVPRLEALKKEGSAGQQQITQYTRWLTIMLAVLQATSFTMLAANGSLFGAGTNIQVLYQPDNVFLIIVMILTMTAGTSIIMWFGELITDRGIGNGMSILIFTQIIARFPSSMWSIKTSNGWAPFVLVILIGLLVMAGVVFVEQAQRRIPVQYAKRMVGNRVLGGTTTYIPLKVNQSGVIPVIFASSIIYLPVLYSLFAGTEQGTVGAWISTHLAGRQDGFWYNFIFLTLIIFFCYFYVGITFNPVEISDNMKKYGGFIPGIRAGKPTEDYLAFVLSRLTLPGSIYLALISLIPTLAIIWLGNNVSAANFPFGGTSLLIMVGVGLNTVTQIESQLHQRNYEGFLK
jgi:preprotein translocase subunit SecY